VDVCKSGDAPRVGVENYGVAGIKHLQNVFKAISKNERKWPRQFSSSQSVENNRSTEIIDQLSHQCAGVVVDNWIPAFPGRHHRLSQTRTANTIPGKAKGTHRRNGRNCPMFHGQVEGTEIVVLDPRFKQCFAGHVRVERLWTGARWSEGPAWFAAGRYLVWSDIPNNRMMRFVEPSGEVSVFRERSNNSNGNSVDNQGRLVTCEHLTRRVTRTEIDGSITVLADKWNGKRFNSPNDLVVKSDDSIWFTDPAYGIDTDYEGDQAPEEIGGCHVYRLDPKSGAVDAVVTDAVRPNGIAFSPDEKYLYLADTGASHKENGPKHIRKFAVHGSKLSGGEVFADSTSGLFDGFRVDTAGRIWTSTAEGVHVYDPDGTLIGKILIPELVANVTFGGTKLNRLFICGTTSLYSMYVSARGSKLG
jgi:gluconolactonase